jgi:hypothetical protein
MKHLKRSFSRKSWGEETSQPNQEKWQNRQNNEQPGSKYEDVRGK